MASTRVYNTISLSGTNASASNGILLGPYGTSAGNTRSLLFQELAANGAMTVGFKGPDSISANVVWTLPNIDATTAGMYLASNASGVLSWSKTGLITVANTSTQYGPNACANLTTATNNTVFGQGAGAGIVSSGTNDCNTVVGALAGNGGQHTLCLGYQSGPNNTGTGSIYAGDRTAGNAAGAITNGIFIGTTSGFNALASSEVIGIGTNTFTSINATNGIAIGLNAGNATTTGANCVFVGPNSGTTNTTGSTLTLVGNGSNVSSNNLSNSSAFGNGAVVDASNTIVFGNGSVTLARFGVDGTNFGTSSNRVGNFYVKNTIHYGSVQRNFTKSSATSYTVDSTTDWTAFTSTNTTIAVTLPAANTLPGLRVTLSKDASTIPQTITISRSSTDTLWQSGKTSVTLTAQYDTVTLVSDGVGFWYMESMQGAGIV